MIVAIPQETYAGERRVALIPSSVPGLVRAGFEVWIESGAGRAAGERRDVDWATLPCLTPCPLSLHPRCAGRERGFTTRQRPHCLTPCPSSENGCRHALCLCILSP